MPCIRLSLLPVVVLLLGALSLFVVTPAGAQDRTIWSATLTVKQMGSSPVILGCNDAASGASCTSSLTDNDIIFGGYYQIRSITFFNGSLLIIFRQKPSESFRTALSLHVDTSQFPLTDSSHKDKSSVRWRNTGLSWSAGDKVSLSLVESSSAAPPLTAAFEQVPSEHDGAESFALDVRFSEAFNEALGPDVVEPSAASFTVQAGKVTEVERVVLPGKVVVAGLYRVRVKPKNWKDVTVTLAPPSGCAATGAVCAPGAWALSNTVTATVGGPVRILIEGARAKEGKDASLDFAVTLNRAASKPVSVDYATADETATAGADYTATSGTLVFAAGETAKTVSVPVLDDVVDEGKEILRLKLTKPRGAYLRHVHRQARGVIKNDDPLQRAWLSRFGRTAATHVTDAVGDRLRGAPGEDSHLMINGYRVPLGQTTPGTPDGASGSQTEAADRSLASRLTDVVGGLLGLGSPPSGGIGTAPDPWLNSPNTDPRVGQHQSLPAFRVREVLQGSAFRLNLHAADARAGVPRLTAWGRFAGTTFDGRAGELALDGDVFTGTVGVDGTWDRLLAGVAVAHSRGTGGFTMPGMADRGTGDLEQTLTSLHPYLRYAVTDRLDVWGLVGYGWGELDLELANGVTVETDTTLVMGAFGGRGILLAPADTGGVQLATRTDAMLTRTSSDAVVNSAATDADAHRLRVVLEGSRAVTWADGRSLTPTLELGVRHDWGDAETGFGLELGGRVQYADPALGLTIEGTVRGLLAHEDEHYQEWGASGTVRLAPGPAGRGLALTLAPTWGVTASGVDGLWARQTTQGLAPQGTQATPAGQLAADVGYGFAAFDTGLLTPYAGTVLAAGAGRTYRLGARWASVTGLALTLEGLRQEPAGPQPVNQGLRLHAAWGF